MSYDLRFAVKVDIGNECRFVNIGYPEYDHPTYNYAKMFRTCMNWNYKQGEYYKLSDIEKNILRGIKELEKYMNELSSDMTEMIGDASNEEKTMLKQKLQTLSAKII